MKKIIYSILFLAGLFLLTPSNTHAQEVINESIPVDKKILKKQVSIEKARIQLEKDQEKIKKLK